MAKKLAICLAALALLLSLTACGGQETPPEDETELSIAASFAEQESSAAAQQPPAQSETAPDAPAE
ncbi:MAG: hypothetical protein IKN72_08610 [Clostridia bacterium]|nr:hypothetical protein [Clostridia bacterium]MBR3553432.1 hypothetical protein [Clostridia bacterium]